MKGISVLTNNKIKTLKWESMSIGSQVKFKRNSNCKIESNLYSEIDLNRTKGNYMMIIASKKECLEYIPTLILSSSVVNIKPSGMLVLLSVTTKRINRLEKVWTIEDFNLIKKAKPNILKSQSHFNSSGFYASFGNKGCFDSNPNTSVGQYVTKKSTSVTKQNFIETLAKEYECHIADDISRSTKDISKFVPKIKTIISPVIATAYELQSSIRNINIQKCNASRSGCWQTSICIDASTGELHTEKDCTYTLISIPNQNTITSKDAGNNYHFLFSLTDKKRLNIPLYHGTSFIFSATFLTHRQHINDFNSNDKEVLFNVASYGNKRLYHHIKKSFKKAL